MMILNRVSESSGGAAATQVKKEPLGLWAQIREDWETHGRDWTRPGFRALAVHRFGVWRMTIKSRLVRAPLSVIYRMLYRYVRNHYTIELFYTVQIGRRVMIAHQGSIVFHDRTVVGDDCMIRQCVTLGASSHKRAWEAPRLGRGVQVGAGAMILGDITIGDNAAIGANVVVTTDVPPNAKVVVAPSRIIPERQRDLHLEHEAEPCDDQTAVNLRGGSSIPALAIAFQYFERFDVPSLTNAAQTACLM
jgi:serine O-acetyltransferase